MGSERAFRNASWYPSAPAAGVFNFGQFTYYRPLAQHNCNDTEEIELT